MFRAILKSSMDVSGVHLTRQVSSGVNFQIEEVLSVTSLELVSRPILAHDTYPTSLVGSTFLEADKQYE